MIRHLKQLGSLPPADILGIVTSSVEDTSRGKVNGGGDLPLQLDVFGFFVAKLRNGAQEGSGIRMDRVFKKVSGLCQLANGPQIHNGDTRTDILYHR